jgi:hypothetical protein
MATFYWAQFCNLSRKGKEKKGGKRERYREFFFAKKWAHVITL